MSDLLSRAHSLGDLTTWGVGGNSSHVYFPRSWKHITTVLGQSKGIEIPIIGAGSNVLAPDGDFLFPVLCTSHIEPDAPAIDANQNTITVDGSTRLPRVARFAASHGILGLEYLVGIPGTVGGGISMNAGTGGPNGPCMADNVLWIEILMSGIPDPVRVPVGEIQFAYRWSSTRTAGGVIRRACLRGLATGEPQDARAELIATQESRRRRQPKGIRTAGSVFLPHEEVSAGYYIDRAGLKGASVGGAWVSTKHANWIVAGKGCTSLDVKHLIRLVKDRVFENDGVELRREIHYLPDDLVLTC